MSRVANNPVAIPTGVEVTLSDNKIAIKGAKGKLERKIHPAVSIKQENRKLLFTINAKHEEASTFAGTARALASNMILGVTKGFEKHLELRGVGYRAQVQDKKLMLALGYSHPVNFDIPEGITITA